MRKAVSCPECGRRIKPSNLARHRHARHLPRPIARFFGTEYKAPAIPIRVGLERDRRYDELVPRGIGPYRYRIYRLRGGELQLVAAAETDERMGRALVYLHGRGRFIVDDSVGVLDTATDPGHWIVSPFTLGRRRPEDG